MFSAQICLGYPLGPKGVYVSSNQAGGWAMTSLALLEPRIQIIPEFDSASNIFH